jgi:hypothetical protein
LLLWIFTVILPESWTLVVWHVGTNVAKETTASAFWVEDLFSKSGGSRPLKCVYTPTQVPQCYVQEGCSAMLHRGHYMSSEPNFQHSDPRMKLSIREAKIMNSFGNLFFQNFKKVGFLIIQISKIFWMVCETKQRRKIRSHSDPRMKLPTCEAKIMNSFGDFFSSKF